MKRKKALYKTTIVIWTRENPEKDYETLEELARAADKEGAYCSIMKAEKVKDPQGDPDWDGTEFFD